MRLALTTAFRQAGADVARAEADIAKHERELASGRRINALSDDPVGAAAAIVQRGALASLDRYSQTSDSLETKLTLTDTVLSDIITQVDAGLASVAGAKNSTTTADQREGIAIELEGIRDSVYSDVNTTLRGSYLFAGAATTTQPYTKDAMGVVSSYQGDNTAVLLDVDEHTALQASMDGDALFRGGDANDFFVEIDLLIAALRAGDRPGIDAGMEALRRQFDRATVAQTRVGTDLSRLGNHQARLEDQRLDGIESLSRLEDADLTAAVTGLESAEGVHETVLYSVSKRLTLSLFDFIR